METNPTTTDAKVQRVTKKSSDELLRKFAEVGTNEKKELRLIKRRKKMKENQCESSSNGSTAVVERRSLLPATVSRKSVLRQLRVRDNRNKSSLLGTIHKVRPQLTLFVALLCLFNKTELDSLSYCFVADMA